MKRKVIIAGVVAALLLAAGGTCGVHPRFRRDNCHC